ncbi:MAG: methylated-DNA--[protein]-cysteine S-methyltransferase [Rikenellaceae bacterium]
METRFAVYSSPIGYIRVEHIDNKLSLLHVLESQPIELGTCDKFTDMVFAQIMEYIKSERKCFDVELDISRCSEFQTAVLRELIKIPYAATISYKQIAEAIGNPKASRAVGSANNHNPIHIIIPCHRVVGSRGELTGYAAGLELKEFLLNLENAVGR